MTIYCYLGTFAVIFAFAWLVYKKIKNLRLIKGMPWL